MRSISIDRVQLVVLHRADQHIFCLSVGQQGRWKDFHAFMTSCAKLCQEDRDIAQMDGPKNLIRFATPIHTIYQAAPEYETNARPARK